MVNVTHLCRVTVRTSKLSVYGTLKTKLRHQRRFWAGGNLILSMFSFDYTIEYPKSFMLFLQAYFGETMYKTFENEKCKYSCVFFRFRIEFLIFKSIFV